MNNFKKMIFIVIILLLQVTLLLGQGKKYEGPDDPAADIAAEREGWMTGNRVLLYFRNNSELANWPNWDQSKWPNDHSGTGMHDGIGLFLGAKVYIENDSIPVPDVVQRKNRTDLDTLYFCETSYRHGMDTNPEGTIEWGLYPVFGYFDENSEHPAMSNRPDSWPQNGWPSRGDELKWPGEWDGRFGRGVKYADLETYFVANDAQDQEYLQASSKVKYYPRPGVFIGDKRSQVTIQKGYPWGGMGVRVKVRGYQWNNPQSRDAIFWEYDIANISDYDLNDVAFGYWLDNGIGHRGNVGETDDIGYFDKYENISYSWDVNGVGVGGMRTGITGIAFLESPGIPDDGLDNDDDGLTDEKRDNQAQSIVGPLDGISDLQKFLDWNGLTENRLIEHWDADEDQDWRDGVDANENGVYDLGEEAGDDVGTDGVAPIDINYNGPDMDGTECNHRPDFTEGLGSEPNFGPLDVSESDMLGLTAFTLFHHPAPWEPPMSQFDRQAYDVIATPGLLEFFGELANLIEMFGTGTFPLLQGRTERISMSEIHSYEELEGLQSEEHVAHSMFEKKRIVQYIYDSDYRFAKPPEMPTLTATPGDGKVFLTWDYAADSLTREPMLKGVNDFEGYKLYKSTDKYFSDSEKLMDMYGNPIGKLPIFQCDLKDEKRGAADFVQINGESFNLGYDSGIKHHFVDTDVENGRTYYYGLVAYDYGIDGLEVAIMPAENNVVIDLDESENVRFTGKNVAIVTPRQPAAGYIPPEIEFLNDAQLMGNGISVIPEVFDNSLVQSDHVYRVTFEVDSVGFKNFYPAFRHETDLYYVNSGFSVFDETDDKLVYRETRTSFPLDNLVEETINSKTTWIFNPEKNVMSEIFDGLRLNINAEIIGSEFDSFGSGWVIGDSPINVKVSSDAANYFPWQYDIIFTDQDSAYKTKVNVPSLINTADGLNILPSALILENSFNFYVINRLFNDSTGAYHKLDLVVHDINQNGTFELETDEVIVGGSKLRAGTDRVFWSGTIFSIDFMNITGENEKPKTGDVYRLNFKRPFTETDTLRFKVKPEVEVNTTQIKTTLDEIKVVPNPYVMTNSMEPALSNPNLNQRRRLLFTHIPAECTIMIFTSNGAFVDEIIVDNPPSNGTVHWDMLSREGLEIAAGVYLFHVKSDRSGDEKLGKFAVIK